MADNALKIKSYGLITGASPLGKWNPLWTPALLPGVAAWWDADHKTVDTATPPKVATWVERISDKALTIPTGAEPTAEGSLNGHVPARFTSGRYLIVPAMVVAANPVVAIAANFAAAPSVIQCLFSSGDGRFNLTVGATGALSAYMGSPTNPNVIQTAAGIIGAGLHIIVCYLDASGSTMRIRVNSVERAAAEINSGTAISVGGRVGQYVNGLQPVQDASIGEIVFGGGAQALVTIQKMEGYLAQKFSGAGFLPAGQPYRSIVPRKRN